MEDNDEVACDEAFQDIHQNITIKKSPKTEHYPDSEDFKISSVPVKKEYNMPKRRGRPRKRSLDIKSQSSTTSKLNYSTMDLELGLKKGRFRPIRPKPFPPGASLLRHKFFGAPLTLNMSTLTSNRVIVTVPSKDKTRNVAALDGSSKTINYVKPGNNNIRNITSKESKANEELTESLNTMANTKKGLRNAKTASTHLPHKSGIELFFESMAQTVLNLPMEVQADIKMKICKIVTMAEMKYCGSQMRSKTD